MSTTSQAKTTNSLSTQYMQARADLVRAIHAYCQECERPAGSDAARKYYQMMEAHRRLARQMAGCHAHMTPAEGRFLAMSPDRLALAADIATLCDVRVPQPGRYAEYGVPETVAATVDALYAQRARCTDARVEEIDIEILSLLTPYLRGR